MAEYFMDIQKYTDTVDEEVVTGIVKHLGIALRSRDASLVSCKDKVELYRVRKSFLKKKLQLTLSDGELDQAIGEVCETMKNTSNKYRVKLYYLLAEKFDKFSLFKKAK